MPSTKPVMEPSPYAGSVRCLRCDEAFESWDRRQNRLCARCLEYVKAEPSPAHEYQVGGLRNGTKTLD